MPTSAHPVNPADELVPVHSIPAKREAPRASVRRSLLDVIDEFGGMVEARPQPVMLGLLFLFVVVAISNNQRPLWYDELTTNLPAQIHTPLLQVLADIRNLVQHGTLSALLARVSTGIFGFSTWALRLPATLGYLFASVCMFEFLRRAGVGNLFALFAVLLFWSTTSFYFATEARPYGLILGLAAALLLAWQRAVAEERTNWPLAGIAVSELCLICCHPLAILAATPVFLAEITRFQLRRKTDWPLWLAAGWPALGAVPLFLLHTVHPAYSPLLTGNLLKGVLFYTDIIDAVAIPLLLAAFVVLAGGMSSAPEPRRTDSGRIEQVEYALLGGGLLIPFIVNAVLAVTATNPYFPRYSISGTLPVPMITALILARRSGNSRRAGIVALGAAAAAFLFGQLRIQQPAVWNAPPVAASNLVENHKDLPLVAASGLTFTEMANREPAPFLSRVFYLRDPEGAVRYANSGIFESQDFANYVGILPHHGNLAPYADFIRAHPRFLVYGTANYWEDWLLRRLLAEGAQLVWLGQVRGSYKDVDLYEITVSSAGARAMHDDPK